MISDEFWQLIDRIERTALHSGDCEGAVAPLRQALTHLKKSNLEGFEENLSQALYQIDGEIFANNAAESGDSGDGFLYCRCYVVACGKEYYQRVLDDPMLMPKDLKQWCEPLLYITGEAWAEAKGCDFELWDFDPSVSYETGSNEDLWDFDYPDIASDTSDDHLFIEQDLDRASSRAGHAYRSGKFSEVVLLLGQHEENLSKKLNKMLQEARAEQNRST